MTIEERLEKLESELARAKRGNRRLLLAGAGLLLGLFALLVVGRSMTSVAQGQEKAATIAPNGLASTFSGNLASSKVRLLTSIHEPKNLFAGSSRLARFTVSPRAV